MGHKENEGGPTLVIVSRCYILAYQLRFVMQVIFHNPVTDVTPH